MNRANGREKGRERTKWKKMKKKGDWGASNVVVFCSVLCVYLTHVKLFSSSFLIHLHRTEICGATLLERRRRTPCKLCIYLMANAKIPFQWNWSNMKNYFTGTNWPLIFPFSISYFSEILATSQSQNVDDLILAHSLKCEHAHTPLAFLDKSEF